MKTPVVLSTAVLAAACAMSGGKGESKALVIQEQGSFAIDGTVVKQPDGRTFHGDHAYVFYSVQLLSGHGDMAIHESRR